MKCSGMWVLAQSTPRWVFIHPVDSGLSRPKPQEHQSLQEAVMVSWDSTWATYFKPRDEGCSNANNIKNYGRIRAGGGQALKPP